MFRYYKIYNRIEMCVITNLTDREVLVFFRKGKDL